MDPSEAMRVSVSAIEHETDPESPHWSSYQTHLDSDTIIEFALSRLTDGLLEAAGRMRAAEAEGTCRQIGELLSSRLELEPDVELRCRLAWSLARIAGKMAPAQASQVCNKAIDVLVQARSERPEYYSAIDEVDEVVAMLLPRLDLPAASAWARKLGTLMAGDAYSERYSEHLNAILTDTSREQVSQRIARIAKSAGPGVEARLVTAAHVFAEPFPCRLTTQELVDLLKCPPASAPPAASYSTTSATALAAASSTTGPSSATPPNKNSTSTSPPRPAGRTPFAESRQVVSRSS